MRLEKQLDSIVQFVLELLSRFPHTRVIENAVYPNEKRNILQYLVKYKNARSIDEQKKIFKQLSGYISLLCKMPESRIFYNYFSEHWASLEMELPFIREDADYLEIKNQLLPRASHELAMLMLEVSPALSLKFSNEILALNKHRESLEEIFHDFTEDEPDSLEKHSEIKKLLTTLKNDFFELIGNAKKIKLTIILDRFLKDIEKTKKMIESGAFSEREKITQKQSIEIKFLKYHEENRKKIHATKFIARAKILIAQKKEYRLIVHCFLSSQKNSIASALKNSSNKFRIYDHEKKTPLLRATMTSYQTDSLVHFFSQKKRVLYPKSFVSDSENFSAKTHQLRTR